MTFLKTIFSFFTSANLIYKGIFDVSIHVTLSPLFNRLSTEKITKKDLSDSINFWIGHSLLSMEKYPKKSFDNFNIFYNNYIK